MHVLVSHIPEFIQVYGTLANFSQQGLEKLNDGLTKVYFQGSNHREQDSLQQMLLKLNRLEELSDNQFNREKERQVCSVCKNPGHNCRTCKQKV